MVKSPNSVPKNEVIQTHVCIVGAGAAGITLARAFIDQAFEVCLLESGSMGPARKTRSPFDGYKYWTFLSALTLHARAMFRWYYRYLESGRCEELEELDFETRPWIPHSGWPFPKLVFNPFTLAREPFVSYRPMPTTKGGNGLSWPTSLSMERK